ncbi:hypothetical protein BC830DRAFT_861278 [Chytriomyces sp. MP71]|nr:hypothetical protein BC830DRAFT_861278 [Chytriomyces sp. MP71]
MNIHRWRKLSGSDPTMFELINKMQALQRRLIVKTEEVVEKETIINHKDKLYLEVKNLLQKQPGPEVLEEVQKLKANVKLKVRECKSLASELNMYHSQVNEYKYEIQRQNHDFQDLKKKYYELKKRDREIRLDRLRMTQQEAGYGQMLVSAAVAAAQVPKMNLVKENNGYHVSKEITQTTLPALKPHYHGPKFSGGGFNMGLNFKPEGTRHNTAEDAKMTMSEAGMNWWLERAKRGKEPDDDVAHQSSHLDAQPICVPPDSRRPGTSDASMCSSMPQPV